MIVEGKGDVIFPRTRPLAGVGLAGAGPAAAVEGCIV